MEWKRLPWQTFHPTVMQEEDFELVALMFELGGYHHPCFVVVPRGYSIPLHHFGRRRITHSESEHFENHVKDNKLLAIMDLEADRSTETREQAEFRYPSLKIDDQLDFVKLRSWLEDCFANHQKCKSHSHNRTGSGRPILVIDCESRTLLSPPEGCVYAALSYVWGPQQSADSDILRNAPQIVKDSMFVALGLGLRYLWVDRLCVPLDAEQKHQEIQQMDMIYSGAEVTIIDAAGYDANCGLQGVGARGRSGQRHAISSDGTEIVSCLHDPVQLIRESPWSTRAWTLQEGILSRRCLILTKEQAYFECLEGRRAELVDRIDLGFNFPLRVDPLRHTSAFSREIEISYTQEVNVLHQLLLHICDYTSRTLTYDSDSLSAILGILNAAKSKNFTHHYGIPFRLGDQGEGFIIVLACWSHRQKDASAIHRREEFPSWSYVGFAAAVQFPPPCDLQFDGCSFENIAFESTNGHQITLDKLIALSVTDKKLYTTVTFEGQVLKPDKLDFVQPSSRHFIVVNLAVSIDNSTRLRYVHIKSCSYSQHQYWLIVRPKNGFAERIGVLETKHIPITDVTEKDMIKLR
jgi:hypothetical protein